MTLDLSWMDEYVASVYTNNYIYKFMCFFLGKRKTGLTYKELFAIIEKMNSGHLSKEEASTFALQETLKNYYFNNKRMPKEEYKDEN